MKNNTSGNQNITIRKGGFDDLEAMQLLFTDTIEVICKKDYNAEQRKAWQPGADNEERWMNVIRDQYVLIAEYEHQIAGFCTLDQSTYIDLLFVHKDYQQKGIASMLYDEIEKEARLHHSEQLTAEVSKTARPFFEKVGFHVIQEQTIDVKGIALINYKMTKDLIS